MGEQMKQPFNLLLGRKTKIYLLLGGENIGLPPIVFYSIRIIVYIFCIPKMDR